MAETTATSTAKTPGRRKTLIGEVVSTKMAKTIVIEVRRQTPTTRMARRILATS